MSNPELYDDSIDEPMVYSECAESNNYLTAEAAIKSGQWTLKPGAPLFIWRYEDGTYDWSAIRDCTTPGHPGAVIVQELVAEGGLGRYAGRQTQVEPRRVASPSSRLLGSLCAHV